MGTKKNLSETLSDIISALVDKPEDVKVEERGGEGTRTLFFLIHCNPDDCGKVIGKKGTTIRLIRELFQKMVAADGRKSTIIEVEDPRGHRNPYLNKME